MARIRSVKPELRRDLTAAEWPREVRYAWVLLWGYLDDSGRGLDDLRLLVADLFPLDRDVTTRKLDSWLKRMTADSDHGTAPLCRYEIDGRRYLHAPKWDRSQRVSHPQPSKVPACPTHDSELISAGPVDNSRFEDQGARKPRESAISTGSAEINSSRRRDESAISTGSAEINSSRRRGGTGTVGDASAASQETSTQVRAHAALEPHTNQSGTAPEPFRPSRTPEGQGVKGSREQGVKGSRERVSPAATGSAVALRPERVDTPDTHTQAEHLVDAAGPVVPTVRRRLIDRTHALLAAGTPTAAVAAALTEWHTRDGAAPGLLDDLTQDQLRRAHGATGRPRPSTTDTAVGQSLRRAAELRAQEASA